jgi:hypothetical protein
LLTFVRTNRRSVQEFRRHPNAEASSANENNTLKKLQWRSRIKPAEPEAAPKTAHNIIRRSTDITASRDLENRTAASKVLRTIRSSQKLHNLLITRRLELKYAPNPTRT